MPASVLLEIPFEFASQVRRKRHQNRIWGVDTAAVMVTLPNLTAAEAPLAGSFAYPGGEETYRVFNGHLYREVQMAGDRNQLASVPVKNFRHLNPQGKYALMSALPLVSKLPWSAQEPTTMMDLRYGGDVAETFQERRAEGERRAYSRGGDMIVVDGLLYVPSSPPLLNVSNDGLQVGALSGRYLAEKDPEIDTYGCQYSSQFSLERWEDALRYAQLIHSEAQPRGEAGPGPWVAPPHPPFEIEIVPGSEDLFRSDDMIASARYSFPFVCRSLNEEIPALDEDGLMAFTRLRAATTALLEPDGQTRSTARRGYEAARDMMNAGPGIWVGPGQAQEKLRTIAHRMFHFPIRLEFDPSFAPTSDEILSPSESAALSSMSP